MNKSAYLFVLLVVSTIVVDGRKCPNPPVVKNFNVKAYTGVWYEIGKIAPTSNVTLASTNDSKQLRALCNTEFLKETATAALLNTRLLTQVSKRVKPFRSIQK